MERLDREEIEKIREALSVASEQAEREKEIGLRVATTVEALELFLNKAKEEGCVSTSNIAYGECTDIKDYLLKNIESEEREWYGAVMLFHDVHHLLFKGSGDSLEAEPSNMLFQDEERVFSYKDDVYAITTFFGQGTESVLRYRPDLRVEDYKELDYESVCRREGSKC